LTSKKRKEKLYRQFRKEYNEKEKTPTTDFNEKK